MIKGLKRGDWVTWAYRPEDPEGPYGYLISKVRPRQDNHLDWCIIRWSLLRYTPPPYKVLCVRYLNSESRLVEEQSDGYSQIATVEVEVVMGSDIGTVKPRRFSSDLLVRVPDELVEELRLQYKRLGGELHVKYKPPL